MEGKDNLGLYLNMKIYSSQNGSFDKTSNYKEINTFIENKINKLFIVLTESNDIKGLEQQSYMNTNEKILFIIKKENTSFSIYRYLDPKLIWNNINSNIDASTILTIYCSKSTSTINTSRYCGTKRR